MVLSQTRRAYLQCMRHGHTHDAYPDRYTGRWSYGVPRLTRCISAASTYRGMVNGGACFPAGDEASAAIRRIPNTSRSPGWQDRAGCDVTADGCYRRAIQIYRASDITR